MDAPFLFGLLLNRKSVARNQPVAHQAAATRTHVADYAEKLLQLAFHMPAAKLFGVTAKQLKALESEVHGLCIPLGSGRAILYNDSNPPPRQQSDVAHEASHVLLRQPTPDLLH